MFTGAIELNVDNIILILITVEVFVLIEEK